MNKTSIICLTMIGSVAILAIGGIESLALSKGIDGVLLAGSIAAVTGVVTSIGGYLIGRRKIKKGKKK